MKLFKKDFYIIGEKPQTDWRRVLITAIILALFVASYGFVFYRQISVSENDMNLPMDAVATSTVESDEVGRKMELNRTIELYSKKKENFEKMISELKKS